MGSESISLLVAFGAGLASFLSPCVIPLVPTYVTYLAGASAPHTGTGITPPQTRWRLMANSLGFVGGFTIIFLGLGLSASTLGQLLLQYQPTLRKAGGVVVVLFGLYMMGILNPGFLVREFRFHFRPGRVTPLNSLLIGMSFSAGWTPCVGPILASILVYAGTRDSVVAGATLLLAYSLGMALPFLAAAYLMGRYRGFHVTLARLSGKLSFVSGLFLVAMGVMLYTNMFFRLSGILQWPF